MTGDRQLASRVRRVRRDLALTQAEFAKRLGVAKISVARYEAGRIPKLTVLKRMSEVRHLPMTWLLHGDEEASNRPSSDLRWPSSGRAVDILIDRLLIAAKSKGSWSTANRRKFENRVKEDGRYGSCMNTVTSLTTKRSGLGRDRGCHHGMSMLDAFHSARSVRWHHAGETFHVAM